MYIVYINMYALFLNMANRFSTGFANIGMLNIFIIIVIYNIIIYLSM